MRFVKLHPAAEAYFQARFRNENDVYKYAGFAADHIYEVTDNGFADLKAYKTKVQKQGLKGSLVIESGLKYTEIDVGCSACMKKRGIKPGTFKQYEISTLVEVDEDGNYLESELQ